MTANAQLDWTFIIFVPFKSLLLATGMYFAISWHNDREKKWADWRALLRMGAQFVAVFALLLLVLLIFAFGLARTLGLDMSLTRRPALEHECSEPCRAVSTPARRTAQGPVRSRAVA
jgi:hypothetical protein